MDLVKLSILIPALPIASAFLIGVLLLAFNRTMNRLTKPVSFLIINSALLSSLYAVLLFYKHISAEYIYKPFSSFNIDYSIDLGLNNTSEISIAVIGLLTVSLMIINFVKLPRSKGYVLYFVFLSTFLGAVFFFFLSNTYLNILPFSF